MSSSSKAFVTVNRPLALEIRRMEIVYSSIVTVKEGERRGFFFRISLLICSRKDVRYTSLPLLKPGYTRPGPGLYYCWLGRLIGCVADQQLLLGKRFTLKNLLKLILRD